MKINDPDIEISVSVNMAPWYLSQSSASSHSRVIFNDLYLHSQNSEKFQNFHVQALIVFLSGNDKNEHEILEFHEFILYIYDFCLSMISLYFREKLEKSYLG